MRVLAAATISTLVGVLASMASDSGANPRTALVDHAQIGLARSRDGISGWQRHPANPIVRPGNGEWDHDACYKPFAIFDGERWLLWCNGRHGGLEQIGVAIHQGEDLGFPNQ